MLQYHFFPDNSFVVHKAFDGKTSAWYDAQGRLLDAEFRDTRGHTRTVAKGTLRYERLAKLGRLILAADKGEWK